MPSTPSRAVESISGPAELVQAIPYLLGFHPAESLVLVGLSDGRLVVTARLDLADAFRGALEHTVGAMHRGGSREFLAVSYPGDPAGDPTGDLAAGVGDDVDEHQLAALLTGAVAAVGATVSDVLSVTGGRWRSLRCVDADCCPPHGVALPAGPSPFAAAATVAGVVALADRDCVGRQLDPIDDPEAVARMRRLVASAGDAYADAVRTGQAPREIRSLKRSIFAAARAMDEPDRGVSRRSALRAGIEGRTRDAAIDDETLARFGVALARTTIRDPVWAAIDGGRLDGRVLWRELARRLPEPYDAPALFLFGWASWRAGNGALASIAADRAVTSDPSYSAADLLLAALSHGINPHTAPRIRLSRPA